MRLKEALKIRGMKAKELSDITGISESSISQYISGYSRPIDTKKISVLAEALNVSEAWLMGYDVAMEHTFIPVPDIVTKKIPLIGTTAAGLPIEAINDNECIETDIDCDCALNVKGDSMVDAGIYNGDIALIKTQGSLDNGQIGVIIINGEVTLKKYYRYDNTVVLHPCNENYADLVYKLSEIESFRIYGRCVGILRRF